MDHAAVSPDGKLIALGSQDSTHLVFNDRYEQIADIGPQSSYPHYAAFSADGSVLAFNSCHFYNGMTVGVPVKFLQNLKTEAYKEDARTPIVQGGARVYAAAARKDEFIIGDAHGYVRAFSTDGKARWQQFVGSSIGDIDLSKDGKTMAVSSYAGFLTVFNMDAGRQEAHQIGNGNHLERRLWVFWKGEPAPLIW
jgi:WD40 repeat protein